MKILNIDIELNKAYFCFGCRFAVWNSPPRQHCPMTLNVISSVRFAFSPNFGWTFVAMTSQITWHQCIIFKNKRLFHKCQMKCWRNIHRFDSLLHQSESKYNAAFNFKYRQHDRPLCKHICVMLDYNFKVGCCITLIKVLNPLIHKYMYFVTRSKIDAYASTCMVMWDFLELKRI